MKSRQSKGSVQRFLNGGLPISLFLFSTPAETEEIFQRSFVAGNAAVGDAADSISLFLKMGTEIPQNFSMNLPVVDGAGAPDFRRLHLINRFYQADGCTLFPQNFPAEGQRFFQ